MSSQCSHASAIDVGKDGVDEDMVAGDGARHETRIAGYSSPAPPANLLWAATSGLALIPRPTPRKKTSGLRLQFDGTLGLSR